jgi:hypothetical protein
MSEDGGRRRLIRDVRETVERLSSAGISTDVNALGRLEWFFAERVAALEALEDSPWVESLADARGEIETIYAVALYENRSELTAEEQADVAAVLRQVLATVPGDGDGEGVVLD